MSRRAQVPPARRTGLMLWDRYCRFESGPRKGTRLPARQSLQRNALSAHPLRRKYITRGKRAWEEALGAYLVRRFGLMLLTLFGISVIIFLLLRMTPGNIADILFDAGGFVDPADKARIEAQLGLDKSLPVQYLTWIGGLLQGNLGISYQTERPALDEIAPRIPITAKLAVIALTF